MKPVKINLQKGSVFIIFWDSRNEGGNSIAYLSETLLSGLGAMLFSQFFFFFFVIVVVLWLIEHHKQFHKPFFLWFVGFLTQ